VVPGAGSVVDVPVTEVVVVGFPEAVVVEMGASEEAGLHETASRMVAVSPVSFFVMFKGLLPGRFR
jgi:hypothetical protein